jgi:hypothetical protein
VFLREAGAKGLTRSELYTALGRNHSTARVRTALQLLLKQGWVARWSAIDMSLAAARASSLVEENCLRWKLRARTRSMASIQEPWNSSNSGSMIDAEFEADLIAMPAVEDLHFEEDDRHDEALSCEAFAEVDELLIGQSGQCGVQRVLCVFHDAGSLTNAFYRRLRVDGPGGLLRGSVARRSGWERPAIRMVSATSLEDIIVAVD